MSDDFTATAARLLPIAVDRAGTGAALGDVVAQFWRIFDVAEGLGSVLRWLDDDTADTHPITVYQARILSVGDPSQGCPIRWEETDRDGLTAERDANLGTLRNPAVRAVYDVARRLAGTGRECRLVVAYEPNDAGWETKDERGKTIRPSHFRRIARIEALRRPEPEREAPVPDAGTAPAPAPAHGNGNGHHPDPAPEPAATNVAAPDPEPEPEPQPSLADAEPPPEVPDLVGMDPKFMAQVVPLLGADVDRDTAPLSQETVAAFRAWWNDLGAAGQGNLRKANIAAKRAGDPNVASIHNPITVAQLKTIGRLTRCLTQEAMVAT